MFPIQHLILIAFHISVQSVLAFNSCQLESSCDRRSVQCDSKTHLCLCRAAGRLSASGVCLHASNANRLCLLYESCRSARCLLTAGLEVVPNDSRSRDPIWQSLRESVLIKNQSLLAFCRCDRTRPQTDCQYPVIGRQCTHHIHCSHVVAHSQCRDGVCSCNQTHYHFDDNCIQKKNFDELCVDNVECQSNLFCRLSRCGCKSNYDFDKRSGVCVLKTTEDKSSKDSNSSSSSSNIWDGIAKVGGFIIIIVLMLFLCTKKESELQNESITGSHRRRHSTRHRQRSSSINSHRPLTQTSSNASRSSAAYRTFEEPVPIKQTIIMPTPVQLVRSLSSDSSEEVDYNPYQFDTLFPQQSDNDDPPSYEDVVKGKGKPRPKHIRH